MLQGPIKKLIDAGKVVRVCSDGDCDIKAKLKKVNLTQLHDLAHVKKNLQKQLQKIIEGYDFWGDEYDPSGKRTKIGKKNFLNLCNSVKTAVSKCAKADEKATEEDMKTRFCNLVEHYKGKFS